MDFANEHWDQIVAANRQPTEVARDAAFQVVQGEYPALDSCLENALRVCIELDLPAPSFRPCATAICAITEHENIELAGVAGMLAYSIGKRYTPENAASFTTRRPQNIIDRYLKMQKDDPNPELCALNGPARPRSELYKRVYRAFGNDTAARNFMIHSMVGLAAEAETMTAGVAFLPFRLLRFSGIAAYPIITNFLSTYDYAYDIPLLKGNIAYFTASCIHLLSVPQQVRPYYKIIHGDRTTVFHRPDIKSLINVATTIMKENYPTLEDFEHDESDPSVEQFLEIRANQEQEETRKLRPSAGITALEEEEESE
jgi:hypothetical protein